MTTQCVFARKGEEWKLQHIVNETDKLQQRPVGRRKAEMPVSENRAVQDYGDRQRLQLSLLLVQE